MSPQAKSPKLPSILMVLDTLEEHGWIPLRQMAVLLGYTTIRGIYQRQKGKNAIPVIQVGGTKRVYEDAVIEALEKLPADKLGGDGMTLKLYRDLVKRKQREKDDA